MKNHIAVLATFATLMVAYRCEAGDLVISSFQGNGELSVTGLLPGAECRVEWTSSLVTPWSKTWQSLSQEETHTNAVVTFRVPMFYRVVMTTNPAPNGMVLIDSGPFNMGDTYNEGRSCERPVHTVYLDSYYIDRYEVARFRWNRVYEWAQTNGYTFDNSGEGVVLNEPVANVNWYDCVKWCNAASEMEGLDPVYYMTASLSALYRTGRVDIAADCVKWNGNGYRLPTEAEWEKAARGGLKGHHFPWPSYGGIWSNHLDGTKANYYGSGDAYDNGRTPVGYFNGSQIVTNHNGDIVYGADMANGYGLYDMAGNVIEWCWDWWDYNYYQNSPTNNPRGPSSNSGFRVFRDQWWNSGDIFGTESKLRCAWRQGLVPQGWSYHGCTGFRTVRSNR